MKPDEIKKLRENIGLSQTQLAQLLAVSPSTISYWETGERNPQPIYEASIMQLNDKFYNSNKQDEIKEIILKFIIFGGLAAFLLWLFNKD